MVYTINFHPISFCQIFPFSIGNKIPSWTTASLGGILTLQQLLVTENWLISKTLCLETCLKHSSLLDCCSASCKITAVVLEDLCLPWNWTWSDKHAFWTSHIRKADFLLESSSMTKLVSFTSIPLPLSFFHLPLFHLWGPQSAGVST